MNKYLALMNYLYESNKGYYFDILPYLIATFPSDTQVHEVKALLDDLKKSNLIEIKSSNYEHLGTTNHNVSLNVDSPELPLTLQRLRDRFIKFKPKQMDDMLVKLTYKGVNEIQNYNSSKSVIMTNDSIRKSNLTQAAFTFVILIATITQARIAYLTFHKDDSKLETIEWLKSELKSIKESLQSKKISDSIFQKAVKDSLRIP